MKSPKETKQVDEKLNKEQHGSKSYETENKRTEEKGNEPNKETVTIGNKDYVNGGIFKYNLDGKVLDFEFMSNKRVKCPRCGQNFKNILRHLQVSRCKISN